MGPLTQERRRGEARTSPDRRLPAGEGRPGAGSTAVLTVLCLGLLLSMYNATVST